MMNSEVRIQALMDTKAKYMALLKEAEKQAYFKEEYLDDYFYSLAHAIDDAIDTNITIYKNSFKKG